MTEVFPDVGLREPAEPSGLVAAEERLGRSVPTELRQLLLESDGVLGHFLVNTVWSLDQIVETNLCFWSDDTFARKTPAMPRHPSTITPPWTGWTE
ncbi:SMI1/KNR4 family protein [Streptomyces sp. CSDS2]|uniref:SMI1/KNR4 family protein n=1 Tax=Streptomyces sp. CSDS2 TaxID=3055051 RepID=UPI0025B06B97|nr:SMI1/KNR4 family protein [Streptomyces sp. CSDS2]MDN3258230.1 SMI1/KNR4 family protein [Streptomyces sp. CSDS2]